jgi:hypothetical protein
MSTQTALGEAPRNMFARIFSSFPTAVTFHPLKSYTNTS